MRAVAALRLLLAWRHVRVTDRRTKRDWTATIHELLTVHYPQAERVISVLDNLNTYVGAAPYEAYQPADTKRLLDQLEFHYTPAHGRWLAMAEIELSILAHQCLERRIPDQATLAREVAGWEERRNTHGCTIDWHLTTADARIKLKRHYPSL